MFALFVYWPIAASIFAVFILQKVWIGFAHKRRARALGCKDAYRRKGTFPLGIPHVRRALAALQRQDFLTDEMDVYTEMGCPGTWRQQNIGTEFHITSDPENIKAILATQFKEFELGPQRYNVFAPLLGRGIFTSDGKDW